MGYPIRGTPTPRLTAGRALPDTVYAHTAQRSSPMMKNETLTEVANFSFDIASPEETSSPISRLIARGLMGNHIRRPAGLSPANR